MRRLWLALCRTMYALMLLRDMLVWRYRKRRKEQR